jgi:hypothetical protein
LFLPDDVLVEEGADFVRGRKFLEANVTGVGEFLFDDFVAEFDALVADVHAGTGNELLHLLLRLAAERALQQFSRITEFGHAALL